MIDEAWTKIYVKIIEAKITPYNIEFSLHLAELTIMVRTIILD